MVSNKYAIGDYCYEIIYNIVLNNILKIFTIITILANAKYVVTALSYQILRDI